MRRAINFVRRHPAGLIFLLLTVYLMYRIFCFSAEVSAISDKTSEDVCYFIASLFIHGFSSLPAEQQEAQILEMVPIVRKIAHFAIYGPLGFSSMLTLCSFFLECKRRLRLWRVGMWAAGFSLFYAITDEVHQLFVEGRSGSVRDVLIDFSGASLGVVFAAVIMALVIKYAKPTKKHRKYF